MSLTPGTRLGVYEITALLGEGGMGQVFRGTDTKLKRQVALKILPPALAADGGRLARFQREAEVLASLNHPNIAAIFGLEESGDITALVMELVEGEDLSQRIAKGAIPLDEALPIAKQIAEALETAHDQGIVHRDLKPANIKVRPDGTVKVLDFGLAKAMEPAASSSPSMSMSPTITTPAMTQAGVILGTAAYMSPEQARGKRVDKRADIWAFGCVLYEMLTGRRAFTGEDVADTLALVLRGEPDLALLPADTPSAVRALVRASLHKNRAERIGDMAAALFVLRQEPVIEAKRPAARPTSWRTAALIAGSLLLGAGLSTVLGRRTAVSTAAVLRFGLTLPAEQQLTISRRAVALSPDGTRVAYSANGGLFLRRLSEFESRGVPGTDAGVTPTFSPDGQSLAFYADSAIKRVSIDGGAPTTLCSVSVAPTSISWTNGHVLFSDGGTIIKRVSENGGSPEVLVDVTGAREFAFTPQLLPDGDSLLFTLVAQSSALRDRWDAAHVVVQSLRTGVRKVLVESGGDAQYAPTGHIVYMNDQSLFAVPFDPKTLTVSGGAVPVIQGIRPGATSGMGRSAHYAFSSSGTLIYVPGPSVAGQQDLALFGRSGGAEPLKLPPGTYQFPRVSPDGTRLAFGKVEPAESSIWTYGLSRASAPQRITFSGSNRFPVWSADGTRIAFQSDRDHDFAIFWQPAVGGPAERLTTPEADTAHVPEAWSPDGNTLLFSAMKDFVSSLWMLSLRDRTVTPFGDVKNLPLPPDAVFSPDGRWVAYQVGEPGRVEAVTFVQPFPPTGTKYQVAPGGRPLWHPSGNEIFIVPGAGRLAVAGVLTRPTLSFTTPVMVPRGFSEANPARPRTFDILPDGRIVGISTPGEQALSGIAREEVRIVVNWFEELRRLVPVAK